MKKKTVDPLRLPDGMPEFIEQSIRPALHAHGGDLTLTDLRDGVLYFRLTGACHGCPSAWLTAEELVKLPLMAHFPLLRDVVVDNDMDEDMIQLAREVLNKKRVFP